MSGILIRRIRRFDQEEITAIGMKILYIRLVEVGAAVVQIDHLAQRVLSAVVKIRAGQLDIAERRDLEGTVDGLADPGRSHRNRPYVRSDIGRQQILKLEDAELGMRERERLPGQRVHEWGVAATADV